jgi:hypothetical protein
MIHKHALRLIICAHCNCFDRSSVVIQKLYVIASPGTVPAFHIDEIFASTALAAHMRCMMFLPMWYLRVTLNYQGHADADLIVRAGAKRSASLGDVAAQCYLRSFEAVAAVTRTLICDIPMRHLHHRSRIAKHALLSAQHSQLKNITEDAIKNITGLVLAEGFSFYRPAYSLVGF